MTSHQTPVKQLEGPQLWLAVAKVMGLDAVLGKLTGQCYLNISEGKRLPFHPPTNPADAWAMHQHVRQLGYYVEYDRSKGQPLVVLNDYNSDARYFGEGPDDVTALGRAIVEMGK